MKRFILSFGAIFLLLGCAGGQMMQTASFPTDSSVQSFAGVPYFLPKAVIPIVILGAPVSGAAAAPGGAAGSQGGGAGGMFTGAACQTATAAAAPAATTSVTVNAGSAAPAAGGGGTTPKDAQANPNAPKYKLTMAISPPCYMGDPSQRFFLSYQHNVNADDVTDIQVDQNGLLETSTGQATDESGNSAAEFVQLLAEIAELPLMGGTGVAAPAAAEKRVSHVQPISRGGDTACLLPPSEDDLLVDPEVIAKAKVPSFDKTYRIVAMNSFNQDQTIDISIAAVDEKAADPGAVQAFPPPKNLSQDAETPSGVMFRAPNIFLLTVDVTPSAPAGTLCHIGPSNFERYVTLPNGGPLYSEDTSRAPLVDKQVGLTIQNGMLLGVNVNNPSEVLAGISLPTNILAKIISIPSNLLTFHIEQISSQQGLTDAQAKALESQVQLIQAQQALAKAEAH